MDSHQSSQVPSQLPSTYPPLPQSHPSGPLLSDIDNEGTNGEGAELSWRMQRTQHFAMEPVQQSLDSQPPTDLPHTTSHNRQFSTSALPLVDKPYDSINNRSGQAGGSSLAGQSIQRPYSPYETIHPVSTSSAGFFERIKMSTTAKKGQTRAWQLTWSYAPDWILTIGITAAFYLLDGTDGYKREFDLTDTSIQHTFAVHERVPNWMLMAICAGAPIVLMPIVNFLTVRTYWDLHNSSLGVLLSLGLTGTVTNLIKITVGRPRPDLIDRCQPQAGSQNGSPYGLVTAAICTQTDHEILKDGFRSFPSGHSSLSFAGLGFLSFYLAGKLHLWDRRGHTGKAWISLAPLMGAALVAVSRTMDYRHHWQDVLTGSILGMTLSFFSYRQYYPPLTHPLSHQPYSPRIPRENLRQATLPSHRQDTMGSDTSDRERRSPSPTYGPGQMAGGYAQPQAGYGGAASSSLPPGAGYASGPTGMNLNPMSYQPTFPPQKQYSTPVNSSPYEPRRHDTGADGIRMVAPTVEPAPINPFESDEFVQPARDGSPALGAGPEGTVPRPADHAAL